MDFDGTSQEPGQPATPVAPPATEGTEHPAGSPSQTETNFSDLAEFEMPDSGEGEAVVNTQESASGEPAKPSSGHVEVTPAPGATPLTAVQAPLPVPPVAPQAVTPPAQQPAPVVPPVPVAQPAGEPQPTPPAGFDPAKYHAYRTQTVEGLASAYSISEEDATLLATEPEKVLPKLAAQITLNAFEAATTAVFQMLPQAIERFQSQQKVVNEQREAFYKAWPALSKPEAQPLVAQAAGAFMQMNPKATLEEQIKGIGALVSYQLGLGQQPASPVAAPRPTLVPPSAPKPFTPAGAGGSAPSPASGGSPSIFEELARFDMPDSD